MEFQEHTPDTEESKLRWLNSLSLTELDLLREDINHIIRERKNCLENNEPMSAPIPAGQNIEALELETPTYNFLRRADFCTIEDLMNASPSELLRVRGLGRQRRQEIIDALLHKGFDYRKKWNDICE